MKRGPKGHWKWKWKMPKSWYTRKKLKEWFKSHENV
jgi:hypothetical protein